MSGSAFAVTHHAFSSGAGRTSDGNGSHASTLKSPSYTKSVSWQHYQDIEFHIVWLANKQGRTPYAIALKVVSEGRCNEEWTKQFKPMAKEIREEYALKNSTI
ncbi:hypothetical protein NGC38_19960 [Kluyvera cryocrescens]|uniref:hypothetical protein n=1 Tax=Kluyvera cryocrescens TaxID=580 RepID=UPI002DB99ED7|nr:hypothetical protein [Kluyvera cryocrescens]MEB7558800.1 hypothetical protein [Kluyvera cryocrescens]